MFWKLLVVQDMWERRWEAPQTRHNDCGDISVTEEIWRKRISDFGDEGHCPNNKIWNQPNRRLQTPVYRFVWFDYLYPTVVSDSVSRGDSETSKWERLKGNFGSDYGSQAWVEHLSVPLSLYVTTARVLSHIHTMSENAKMKEVPTFGVLHQFRVAEEPVTWHNSGKSLCLDLQPNSWHGLVEWQRLRLTLHIQPRQNWQRDYMTATAYHEKSLSKPFEAAITQMWIKSSTQIGGEHGLGGCLKNTLPSNCRSPFEGNPLAVHTLQCANNSTQVKDSNSRDPSAMELPNTRGCIFSFPQTPPLPPLLAFAELGQAMQMWRVQSTDTQLSLCCTAHSWELYFTPQSGTSTWPSAPVRLPNQ